MAYNDKSIVKDVNGKPVPQYFNKILDRFEVIESEGGMLKVMLVDSKGNEVAIDQILAKLDELIEVVR